MPAILWTYLIYITNARRSLTKLRHPLLRMLFLISLHVIKSVYAARQHDVLDSLENLSFEGNACELTTLKSIYSSLDDETKRLLDISNHKMELLSKEELLSVYSQLSTKNIFKNLEYLDLSGSDIEDLPSSIFSHLKNLKILNISKNPSINLNSPSFKKLCHQLVELNASECNVNEDMLELICNCNILERLDISGNLHLNLTSHGFERLCCQLVELDISKCNIKETVVPLILPHLKKLKKLSISGNLAINLKPEIFEKLCFQLVELNASGCNIQANILTSVFSHMEKLKILDISKNPGIDLNPKIFEKLCSQLVELNASECNIGEDIFSIICGCRKLEKLNISKNPKIKFPEQKIIALKDTLKDLKIDDCNLSSTDMAKIVEFKCLESLDISKNFLKEYFETSDFGDLKKTLSELRACNTGMSFEGISKVRECEKLKILDLSHNDLFKEVYFNNFFVRIFRFLLGYKESQENILFGDLAGKLVVLHISRSNLNVYHLNEILDFSAIEILDCSFNNFSKIDSSFETGKAKDTLQEVNFSNCNISSQIFLEKVLGCRSLSKLNVASNRFTISCKTFTVGSAVKSLKWLDISKSGIELKQLLEFILGKFEAIEYLDLTNNICQPMVHGNQKLVNFDASKAISVFGKLKTSLKILKISSCQIQSDFDFLYSITDCLTLEYLDISSNLLGQFPKDFEFGSSKETLKELHMNNCFMNGANTLTTVTNLPVLKKLNLKNNQFDCLPYDFRFGSSTESLKSLSMANCNIHSISFFQAVANCKVLQVLNLSKNDLSLCNASDFKNFDFGSSRFSLTTVDMSRSGLSSESLLKAITNCLNLRVLNLFSNSFENLPDDFCFGESKDSLKILDLTACSLRGTKILKEITSCRKLEYLNLSFNDFSGEFKNFSFGESRLTLQNLQMDGCQINDLRLFNAIAPCVMLETLSLERNAFCLDSTRLVLGELGRSLKNLNLKGLFISKIEDLYCLFDFPKLEVLNISCVSLEEFEESLNFDRFGLARFTLRRLYIESCAIKHPSSLKIFTSFSKLEIIDFSFNFFDLFPESFSLGDSRNSLIKITAACCNFKDAHIIKALTDCKKLKSLILRKNYYIKMDKVEFGISKDSLNTIDLADCTIKPEVWITEIGECSNIQKLNFARTNLKEIADQFDSEKLRRSLVYLNLSGCGISNLQILSSLTKYHRLAYLELSRNNIKRLTSKFNFGNLEHRLDYFYLENSDNDILTKIKDSFPLLKNLEYYTRA